ncbi:MAG TPA: hypothetical protein VNL77_24500 [Roseiflexaceae bacterium]|nr:hypothetical protein [Roseiflexaceae bacterium]
MASGPLPLAEALAARLSVAETLCHLAGPPAAAGVGLEVGPRRPRSGVYGLAATLYHLLTEAES